MLRKQCNYSMVHSFHWCTVTHRGFPGGGGANHKDGGVNLVFCPISPKSYNDVITQWSIHSIGVQ